MTKHEFKAGDVVQLRSGGPMMTVTRTNDPNDDHPSGLIAVAWFGDDALHRDAFVPEALQSDGWLTNMSARDHVVP